MSHSVITDEYKLRIDYEGDKDMYKITVVRKVTGVVYTADVFEADLIQEAPLLNGTLISEYFDLNREPTAVFGLNYVMLTWKVMTLPEFTIAAIC